MNVGVVLTKEEAVVPTKAHEDDAGWDLYTPEYVRLIPGESYLLGIGVCFEIPLGWFGKIEGRSSVAKKGGSTAGGVIDAGYRGEVSVLIYNFGKNLLEFNVGDRIAQLLILPVPQVKMVLNQSLSDTIRGAKGFGSSGK